jgi:hypothetical protein
MCIIVEWGARGKTMEKFDRGKYSLSSGEDRVSLFGNKEYGVWEISRSLCAL